MRAVGIVLASILVIAQVSARFLTDRELEHETCSSTAYQTVGRVTVANPPTGPIDVLRLPTAVSELKLECFQIFESLTNPSQLTNPTEERPCEVSNAAISICTASDAASVPDAEAGWSCSSIAQYQRTPRTSTTWGRPEGPPLRVKFQWQPALVNPQCYPRDLTVQTVAYAPRRPGSSTAAGVIFILIVVAVGLGVVAFAVYQIHKSITEQFKRAERERALPPTGRDDEIMERGVQRALGYDEGDEPVQLDTVAGNDDLYIDKDDVAVTVTDKDEVLESRPMPKPWYQRANYDAGRRGQSPQQAPESIQRSYEENSRRLDFGASPADRPSSVARRRTPHSQRQRSLQHYYDESERPRALRAEGNSLRGHEDSTSDEEETVLVCSDCGLLIHDRNTPQFCEVTGMRHY